MFEGGSAWRRNYHRSCVDANDVIRRGLFDTLSYVQRSDRFHRIDLGRHKMHSAYAIVLHCRQTLGELVSQYTYLCGLFPCCAWSTSSSSFLIRIDYFCLCISLNDANYTSAQWQPGIESAYSLCCIRITLTIFIDRIGASSEVRLSEAIAPVAEYQHRASYTHIIFILQQW